MPDNLPVETVSTSKRTKQPETPSSAPVAHTTIPTTSDVHFVLQSKGGVGKTFIASALAQWHMERGIPVQCYDTDPQNETLCSFQALNAQHIDILDSEGEPDARALDKFIARLISQSGAAVVDNGSSSFIPMSRYLASNDAATVLAEHQRRLIIHTVVEVADAADTLLGMDALVRHFSVPIVVWVNEHGGAFDVDGKPFDQTPAYQANQSRIAAVIYLPQENPRTFGWNVKEMWRRRLTFAEAIASGEFDVMARSRLFRVRNALFEQIDRVLPAI